MGRGYYARVVQARTSADFELLDTSLIDAVIFDLDQTLLDRTATIVNFLCQQHKRRLDLLGDVDVEQYTQLVLSLDNNGYADKVSVYERVAVEFGLAESIGTELYEDYLERYGLQPVLFPNVHELLTKLSEQYRLGLITNGRTVGQERKISGTQIRDYFETILISETEKIKKPDVRIFERCLERMSLRAECTIYIGDNPTNDIDAPKSIGMKAIWVDHGIYDAPVAVDATVSKIFDVAEILLG